MPQVPSSPQTPAQSNGATEEATPQVGGVDGDAAPLVRAEPPFFYVVHPERWDVSEGRIVPVPSKLSARPGQKNVDSDSKGRPLMENAIAAERSRGNFVVPWNVDGPGRSYLRRVKSTGGWVSKFETVFPGSATVEVDTVGAAKWWRELVDRGVVPAPAPHVLEALAATIARRIDSWLAKGSEGHKIKAARATKDLDVVKKALAKARPPAAATEEATPDLRGA